MSQQVLLQALALLVQKFGYQIDRGREFYVSDAIIASLSEHGQIQVDRHPDQPGFVVRYFHNRTIEGEVSGGGLVPQPQAAK